MDKNIVKTRLGHYWTPGSGAQTALVVGVDREAETVNLVAYTSEGTVHPHLDVPVTQEFTGEEDHASFHLVGSCMPECPEFGR